MKSFYSDLYSTKLNNTVADKDFQKQFFSSDDIKLSPEVKLKYNQKISKQELLKP
jgi:hypothetical protein